MCVYVYIYFFGQKCVYVYICVCMWLNRRGKHRNLVISTALVNVLWLWLAGGVVFNPKWRTNISSLLFWKLHNNNWLKFELRTDKCLFLFNLLYVQEHVSLTIIWIWVSKIQFSYIILFYIFLDRKYNFFTYYVGCYPRVYTMFNANLL